MKPPADGVYCVFIFPDSSESRYVRHPPQQGACVPSPLGTEWYVAEVLQSGRATYTVFCVGRQDFRERFGHAPRGVRELVTDLLERAQQSVTERRQRRRYRHYIP